MHSFEVHSNESACKKGLSWAETSPGAEFVGVSDYVPYNIIYIMFMHHQGYLNKPNKFFQEIKLL